MHTILKQQRRLFGLLGMFCLLFIFSACGTQTAGNGAGPSSIRTRTAPQPSTVQEIEPASPARIIIPAIRVDAPIESVGLTIDGTLATPTQNVWNGSGWYSLGPRPGEVGSAVIDGHLNRPGGSPAVFWNLHLLHTGDQVNIVDTQGKMWHFRVNRIVAYQPQNAPLQQIFGNTGGQYLNLITCAGVWIPSQNQTTLRRVVYTSLEP